MKELSIEEKAKAYDEVLKKARMFYKDEHVDNEVNSLLEVLFPELKESEDNRVKKEIISAIKEDWPGHTDWIDWLEKQGEKEPKKVSIWNNWKKGIAGNGEGKLIYLIKKGNDYSLSSCLSFECDYIELSELDKLLSEKQGGQPKEATYTYEAETGNGNIKSLVTEEIQLPKFHEGEWITIK